MYVLLLIAANPVFLASDGVLAPAHHRDLVVDLRMLEVLLVDSPAVVVKVLSGVHAAPDGAPFPDFPLHVLSAPHVSILISKVAKSSF